MAISRNQPQSFAIIRNHLAHPQSAAIIRNQSQSSAITWRIRNQPQSFAIIRNHLTHLLEEGERLVPQTALGTRGNGSTEADHVRAHAPSSHLPQEIESSRELAALFTRRDRGRVRVHVGRQPRRSHLVKQPVCLHPAVISGHQWQSEAISAPAPRGRGSSAAISVHQIALNGNQCSSVFISGHQCS